MYIDSFSTYPEKSEKFIQKSENSEINSDSIIDQLHLEIRNIVNQLSDTGVHSNLIKELILLKKKAKVYDTTIQKIISFHQNKGKAKKKITIREKVQEQASLQRNDFKFRYKDIEFNAFIVDLAKNIVQLNYLDSGNNKLISIRNCLDFVKKQGKPMMITNAGMYKPDNSPLGLYIENFEEIVNLDLSKPNNDNFYLLPNGVFLVDSLNNCYVMKSDDYKTITLSKKVRFATQSGPMLVYNDTIHQQFVRDSPNRKIRSGVGITKDNRPVFIISKDPVNFFDFATLFRDIFGCSNALFLDGVISKMYLSEINPNEVGGSFGSFITVLEKRSYIKSDKNEK